MADRGRVGNKRSQSRNPRRKRSIFRVKGSHLMIACRLTTDGIRCGHFLEAHHYSGPENINLTSTEKEKGYQLCRLVEMGLCTRTSSGAWHQKVIRIRSVFG